MEYLNALKKVYSTICDQYGDNPIITNRILMIAEMITEEKKSKNYFLLISINKPSSFLLYAE